jgi:hypothetical protein
LENSRRNPTRIMTEKGEVRINQGSMLFWVGSFPHCGAKYEQENSRIFLSVQCSILKEIRENSIEILEHGETRLLYNSAKEGDGSNTPKTRIAGKLITGRSWKVKVEANKSEPKVRERERRDPRYRNGREGDMSNLSK